MLEIIQEAPILFGLPAHSVQPPRSESGLFVWLILFGSTCSGTVAASSLPAELVTARFLGTLEGWSFLPDLEITTSI